MMIVKLMACLNQRQPPFLSPSMFAGTAGNSTSINVMPSSIADKIEFVASPTSSVYDAGLYVILPADFVSLAACGSALHAVVSLCLLRAEPLLKARTDFVALKEPLIRHAGWMRRETSRQEDCIMWVGRGGECKDGCGGQVGGGWNIKTTIRATGNATLLPCYI